jgi:hypothetical protein
VGFGFGFGFGGEAAPAGVGVWVRSHNFLSTPDLTHYIEGTIQGEEEYNIHAGMSRAAGELGLESLGHDGLVLAPVLVLERR